MGLQYCRNDPRCHWASVWVGYNRLTPVVLSNPFSLPPPSMAESGRDAASSGANHGQVVTESQLLEMAVRPNRRHGALLPKLGGLKMLKLIVIPS